MATSAKFISLLFIPIPNSLAFNFLSQTLYMANPQKSGKNIQTHLSKTHITHIGYPLPEVS